jgi:hypothetical protein
MLRRYTVCSTITMTKLTTGMLLGFGAALIGSWFYAQREFG